MQILQILAILLGGSDYVDPTRPTDNTGRTSIVVIMGHPDSGNWVELRGPGRYAALEEFGE